MQHYPTPFIASQPLTVGANGNGEFRDMSLTVDCRYRMADEVVPWALWGIVAGSVFGAWRGSIMDRKVRQALSSKRRKQREQSKRRRQEKRKTSKTSKTSGRRSVGNPADPSTEHRRRRSSDFQIGYPMHQGAIWGLIAGTTAGLSRTIWRFASGAQPMSEIACREDAARRLKADPSSYWALCGATAGAFMYVAQHGSREPLRQGDGEIDFLLIYTLVGGGGAWALSKWFS